MFMKSGLLVVAIVMILFVVTGTESSAQSKVRGYSLSSGDTGPKLGVSIQDVTAKLKERKKLAVDEGALVTWVDEDSPAEKAGIQEGDVIVKFDSKSIYDSDDLTRAVGKVKEEKEVKIELYRNADKKTVTAKIDKPAKSHGYSFFYDDGEDDGDVHVRVTPPTPPSLPRMPKMVRPFNFHMSMQHAIEGMEVQELNKQLAEYFEVSSGRGLLVTEVEKRSPAADAGFKAGDVIVKVNNSSVRSLDDLHEELYEGEKSSAQVEIVRKGKPQTLNLKVEEWDEEDDDLSFDVDVPYLPYADEAASRATLSQMNKAFLNELQETLSSMQDRIRQKMRRLQERITEKVLSM